MTVFRDMYGNRPERVATIPEKVGRTKQSFKDECDINVIMRRYEKSGVLPQGVGVGSYADFSDVGTFHDAQNVLVKAQAQFDALPARVRNRFRNDPGEFLRFVSDKSNLDEARKLGLLKQEEVTVAPVTPAPPAS